jgi:hypothetical protein
VIKWASCIDGRWKISQQAVIGQLAGSYGKLIILDPYFIPHHRVNSNGIKEINVI